MQIDIVQFIWKTKTFKNSNKETNKQKPKPGTFAFRTFFFSGFKATLTEKT